MAMENKVKKHSMDIIFLMVLFLIFTFSAVSVLLMAVNSYRSVVYANEENANTRTAVAYVREQVRANDNAGAIEIGNFDGTKAIKIKKDDGIILYMYSYDGYLMEMETKEGADVTPDFGNKIIEIKDIDFNWINNQLLEVDVVDASDNKEIVKIGIKSNIN